jgi:hypothetical protein
VIFAYGGKASLRSFADPSLRMTFSTISISSLVSDFHGNRLFLSPAAIFIPRIFPDEFQSSAAKTGIVWESGQHPLQEMLTLLLKGATPPPKMAGALLFFPNPIV